MATKKTTKRKEPSKQKQMEYYLKKAVYWMEPALGVASRIWPRSGYMYEKIAKLTDQVDSLYREVRQMNEEETHRARR